MKEYKENIKMMTKEEIISFSNIEKRQKFLKEYRSWGVWLEIPQLKVKVYKAVLPGNECIFVTEFHARPYLSRSYRYAKANEGYTGSHCYESTIVTELKDLKVKYCEERRKEKAKA